MDTFAADFDVPTLILHGDDDQIVPITNSAVLAAKLVRTRHSRFTRARVARDVHDK
jgi:pimeloyl-ACP methyl ester carboxylesterase